MDRLTGSKKGGARTLATSTAATAPSAVRPKRSASPLGQSVEDAGVAAVVVVRRRKKDGHEAKPEAEKSRVVPKIEASTKAGTAGPAAAVAGARSSSAEALYDYTAADDDEVSLQEGDVVVEVVEVQEGWLKGTVVRTGLTGTLPTNYVQLVTTAQGDDGGGGAHLATLKRTPSIIVNDVDDNDGVVGGPGSRPSSSLGVSAVALYDYEAGDVDEVSFKEGDVFVGVREVQEDWLKGTVVRTCARGTMPFNYVTIQKDGIAAAAAMAERKKVKAEKRRSKRKSIRGDAGAGAGAGAGADVASKSKDEAAEVSGTVVGVDDGASAAAAAAAATVLLTVAAEPEKVPARTLVTTGADATKEDDSPAPPSSQGAVTGARSSSAEALYDYTAADDDEVSLQEGDVVVEVVEVQEGWLKGTVVRTGLTGTLPTNYVQLVNADVQSAHERGVGAVKAATPTTDAGANAGTDSSGSSGDVNGDDSAEAPVYSAKYDYAAADDDEISMLTGEILLNVIESTSSPGWVAATLLRTGATGMVPASYITHE